MRWIEEDHPRDEDGKFTFKNGGETNTNGSATLKGGIEYTETNPLIEAKNIIYNKTGKENKLRDAISRYKSALLNILDDNATSADILYGEPQKLEDKIRKIGKAHELNNLVSYKNDIIRAQEKLKLDDNKNDKLKLKSIPQDKKPKKYE